MEDKFKYKPHLHHRRSIRLKGFDYSKAGLYFITICCQDRISRFGNIENSKMILNQCGEVAFNEWVKLTEQFINFQIDEFQIMPNPHHSIILPNIHHSIILPNIHHLIILPNPHHSIIL